MISTVKVEILLLHLIINKCSHIIYAVSGKLVLARENDFLANDSVVERIRYNSPNGATLQNRFRLPISTTLKSTHTIIANDGKYQYYRVCYDINY